MRDLASKAFWRAPDADGGGESAGAASPAAAARPAWRRAIGWLDTDAFTTALLYAAFGIAWVLWSDRVLFGLSSDVGVLRSLGEWKGLVFVALSALWVGLAGWRLRRGSARTLPARGSRLLLLLLGTAVTVIVCIGVVSAVRASRGERRELSTLMDVVAQSRAAQWSAWVRERRADVESGRAAVEPLAPGPQRAAGLAGLCQRLRCLQARIDDLPVGRATAVIHLDDAHDDAFQAASLEVAAPLQGDRSGRGIFLRFDATAALAALLDPQGADLDGLQLLLSQPAPGGWRWLERASATSLAGRFVAAGVASGWPAELGLSRAFEARLDAATAVVGASAAVGDGWRLLAFVDTQRLNRRGWGDLLWIIAADVAALVLAGAGIFGLQERRELLAARRERAEQDEKLRALGLLATICNSTPDLIFTKDLQGRYTFVNEAACQAFGRPASEVLGRRIDELLPAETSARLAALDARALESAEIIAAEGELATAQGRRWYTSTIGPLRESDGRIGGVFGVVHDLTERRRQEERQRQWAKAFESTRDGVIICDAQARIESVNRAFTEITGYTPEDAIGQTPALLNSGCHEADFYRELWTSVIDKGHWRGEIWNRRRNGEVYPEWLTINAVRDDAGRISNYVGVFTDITRVKRDEAALQRLANYDPLTELPNRRLLATRLEHALAQRQRHGGRAALLYIDLDGFKTVNDSLGHPAGDELLLAMARRLRERVRAEDTLGRLGGDEFVVILESLSDPREAAVVAQDLLDAIARPLTLAGGHEVYVTASIGISLFPDDGCSDATAMMRDADAALYRAKEQGRNCFCFFTHDLNRQAVARLELEVALSHAIERGELLLHYQPKVCTASGRIVGAEALLRWQRGGELVPPALFIPVAEQSSMILDIGCWVIDEVCAQQARWRARGLAMPRVAVNVAARQFAAGDLDAVLQAALARHDVAPSCLELEVTESMLIDRPAEGIAMLRRLKDIGVRLSLDDFGTGYSSLAYLRQFPIDALKVDKSFVDHIGHGPDGSAIVDAVIALAHRLGLTVVAEGVETPAQLAHLRTQGCDELQGYVLARPMPAPDLEALCARGATLGLAAPAPAG